MNPGVVMFLYLVAGLMFVVGTHPLGRTLPLVSARHLVLAGVALAVLTALGQAGAMSMARMGLALLLLLAAAGIGAVMVRVLDNEKPSALVPLFQAGIGKTAILLALAAFLALPLPVAGLLAGAAAGFQLAMVALMLLFGGFTIMAGCLIAARRSALLRGPMGTDVPFTAAIAVVVLSLLLGLMLYAFDQPNILVWFSLAAGLCTAFALVGPATPDRIEVLSPLVTASAGLAVVASGFMVFNIALIMAGGLAAAAGAARAYVVSQGGQAA
jgi:H+-translocating NAD(P) transhydrogenase subunit beta